MPPLNEIMGYELLGTLGHGARSTIYLVKDPADSHVYALKRVAKESPVDQRFLDQAILEHEIASRFNHPTLRKSYKILRRRQLIRTSEVYIVMEFVDGVTLEQHHPATLIELCDMMRQVAMGLVEMHNTGFVHADIKPNNIMVTDTRSVKIIDFGQSCPTGTVKERIQGTPDYIAPEQVLRRRITPRTDIFNLGATLYWVLTRKHVPTLLPKGRPGIDLKSSDLLAPPRDLNPQVPPALSTLVMNCVETSPRDRPASMGEVYERLGVAIAQLKHKAATQQPEAPPAPTPAPPQRRTSR